MVVYDFTVRETTALERNWPYVTSSMVEAINTCPKWGIIHNVQHKRFVTGFRQMALEAGSLMHEVFSIYNLWQLAVTQKCLGHADVKGKELFGNIRWQIIDFTTIVTMDKPDEVILNKLAYNIIGTSDFYDDPNDKNRTLSNLEHVAIELGSYFLMNHTKFEIYVKDVDNPNSEVGIEQSLDVIFDIELTSGAKVSIRFIGLADVVYQNSKTRKITLGEYKTTASMNDAWREAFRTRHQISAYNGALEAYYTELSYNTILTGSTIPVRKTTTPTQHFNVDRDRENVKDFLSTALFSLGLIKDYPESTAIYAPMFTHSCNRYFRPCSLLDLCSSEKGDQIVMWEQMEIDAEMSPSELKALLRQGA